MRLKTFLTRKSRFVCQTFRNPPGSAVALKPKLGLFLLRDLYLPINFKNNSFCNSQVFVGAGSAADQTRALSSCPNAFGLTRRDSAHTKRSESSRISGR